MDLSTSYLGLKLSSPFVIGASPFGDDTYTAQQVEDAGAGAIVMRSLFEEQIYLDALSHAPQGCLPLLRSDQPNPVYPTPPEYQLDPERYLRQIAELKSALAIPVIASLNGCRPGGWISFAQRFEAAGADAIELNLYHFPTDAELSASEVEAEMLETVRLLKASVRIPVAVKLQPYFTALAHFARELERIGVDGIVLFNRPYQSDFNVDDQSTVTELRLSEPAEALLRMRWLALLAPKTHCSLAITGGVHNGKDAIKAILAGAHAVQLVSVLLKHGPRFLGTLADGLRRWMGQHGYRGLADFRGKMNLHGSGDETAVERGDYQRVLQIWKI